MIADRPAEHIPAAAARQFHPNGFPGHTQRIQKLPRLFPDERFRCNLPDAFRCHQFQLVPRKKTVLQQQPGGPVLSGVFQFSPPYRKGAVVIKRAAPCLLLSAVELLFS